MDAAFEAAGSGGYLGDAVEALQDGSVYVSPSVSGGGQLRSDLSTQVGGDSIGVAVFSSDTELSGVPGVTNATDAAEYLLDAGTGYDTIIVSVGEDVSAQSRAIDSEEALRIANEAEATADGVGPALTETVAQVQQAEASRPSGGGDDGGGTGGAVLVIAIVVAVLAAGAATAFAVIRSRRRTRATAPGLPDSMRRHVATLRSLGNAYAQVGAAGDPVAAQTATDIAGIAVNVEELFTRLGRQGGPDQRGVAAAELDATLGKLTAALDRDYLLDLLTHPELWDDPEERVGEVRGALTAVSEDLVRNIKQVNARRGVHFQVSLDGLVGRRSELQEWERAFKQASDDANPPA